MTKFYWQVNFEELREETSHRVNLFIIYSIWTGLG